MFLGWFKVTGGAVLQIFMLGAIGYFLIKRNILGERCLGTLSRLVIEVTLPLMIFCRLVRDFRFDLYPNWWIFPFISILITAVGLLLGYFFVGFVKKGALRRQFLSLTAFQNSGYLPLALIAALPLGDKAPTMLIYLFLLLMGFNLLVWSLGVFLLAFHKSRKFEMGSLFSPPVIATLFSLLFIASGLNNFVPAGALKTLSMAGECTLPLAMFVVGGSLAFVKLKHIDIKAVPLALLIKLFIMPVLGLWLIIQFDLPELIGLLILIELAMPPAVSLSVIIRHYKKEDFLISHGVFFGHVLSLVSLPLFLSLYFTLIMIK